MAFNMVCSVVFSVGMMAAMPGTAVAQQYIADFCADYDNANPQTTGFWTDVRRGKDINVDNDCFLNFTGQAGAASDMWITTLGEPDSGPEVLPFECIVLEAVVVIHKFDNRKAVGLVFDYDPLGGAGIFLGLYDNGNSDGLTFSTFDAKTGKLTSTLATTFLGSKIKENVPYFLAAEVCNDGTNLIGEGFVTDESTFEAEVDFGSIPLPPGIFAAGAIGLAGQAKSALVNATVEFFAAFVDSGP